MKKIVYIVSSVVLLLSQTSCLEDMKDEALFQGSKEIEVGITLPGPLADIDKSDFKLTFRSTEKGFTYVAYTDENGVAKVSAEYGGYTVQITKDIEDEGVIKYLRGSQELMVRKNASPVEKINLDIKVSNKGTIILKEVYFHKSKVPGTGGNYNYDQYFSLYNNSDDVQYLDGIGLGFHPDFNSGAKATYIKEWIEGSQELRDSIPVNAFGMVFPGTGLDYPMQPGDEVVIALSAINHTAAMTVTPINLSTSDVWAMYIPNKTTAQKAPAAGVKVMSCYTQLAAGTQIVFSQASPTIVIYRLEVDPKEYVKEGPVTGRNYGNVMYKPPKYTASPSVMAPKEWVYDGVEFRSAATHVARLCSEISFQPMTISSTAYSSNSYIRKVDEAASAAAGRTIYQDTNNSAEDWMVLEKPTRYTAK